VSVLAEIGTGCSKNRICVTWPGGFQKSRVEKIRQIPGRSYVKTHPKHWHVPQDMETCRLLREQFEDDLEIGPNLKSWAIKATRDENKMGSIARKDTASLVRLPMVLPQLYEAIHLGPLGKYMTEEERQEAMLGPASYQAADVEFLAESSGSLNGNEAGTGKTIEWIAAIWEAGMEEGDHLIICPKAAADATWEPELERWQAEVLENVGIFMCVQDKREERQAVINRWLACELPTRWVVVNPHMLMLRKDKTRTSPMTLAVKGKAQDTACYCHMHGGSGKTRAHEHYDDPFPELYQYMWRSICIDEAHKGVVRNHRSLTFKSLVRLSVQDKKCCMSGTPMKKLGGADLWGMLHYLHPEIFTSYWQMVESFYHVTDNGFGKKVGLLREERQEAFFRMLSPYMLRRTKKECAPWLPEKLYVDVPVHMTPRQTQQYRRMERDSFTGVGRHEISTSATVDKIVRLKQFANAHCKIDASGDLIPLESPKIDAMIAKMEEIGVFEDVEKKQLVFSQSRRMCKLIYEKLTVLGLRCGALHGGTKNRKELIKDFQYGDLQVMVIVTTAGGVSLTLDAADDVHLIDEMWSPDDDEQAEDRAHRVSRIHQVTVYIYRCIGTIDEDIAVSKSEKKESHELILDVRRKIEQRVRM
jgi:SNF2 family DNA or RNA helicase